MDAPKDAPQSSFLGQYVMSVARVLQEVAPSQYELSAAHTAGRTHQPPHVHQHDPSAPAAASASALKVVLEQPLRPVGETSGMLAKSICDSHSWTSGESVGGRRSRGG